MKQQIAALILSALLLSTLAHGPHEKHNNRAHHVEHARHHQPSHILRHHFRDNAPQHCRWECPEGQLTVVVNTTSSIISIVNSTASVAVAIDVNAHLVAVFNGTSGAVVVVNIREGSGVYIAGGGSQNTWISSNQSFSVNINSLTSLKIVYELGLRVGVSFTKTTINQAALQVIAGVLSGLSSELALKIKTSISISLTLLTQISSRVLVVFSGSLSGFLSLVESTTVVIRLDILWFVGVLEGLGQLVAEIRGGIRLLIENSVKLDLKAILVARSGVDVFILIVTVLLQRNIDVAEILGGALSSGERLITILVSLGGNVFVGVTGLLKVVGGVVGLVHKHVTIQALIDILIDFAANNHDGGSLKSELNATIRSLLKLGEKINSSESLDICWSFLKKLHNNELVVNGINISSIIVTLLRVGSISGLEVIVRVLVLLNNVVSVEVSIAYLILGLLIRLRTAAGVRTLILLIPGLKIDGSILEGSGDLLSLILKNLNTTTIKGILNGDWSGIPVIGAIYNAVSDAVKSGSEGKLELSTVLKSSGASSIITYIVHGLTSEINGSGSLSWDVNTETSSITAITEEATPAVTEITSSNGGSSATTISGGGDVSGGGEVSGGTSGSSESESNGSPSDNSGEHGHGHHKGNGNGHHKDHGQHKGDEGHKKDHKKDHKKHQDDHGSDESNDHDDSDEDRYLHHKESHLARGHGLANRHHHAEEKHHSHREDKHHLHERNHVHDKQHKS